ncbi:alpha/beta fold hydrolase [Nocardia australiensis]|uniref:alpha/beta fold hydrolase n=1 Tax=Nocardia australiensis TaxID=2887191 RepID=UPI001D13293C|nr:alpha/beta hydrolase [Nocardia australiensis]
MSRTSITSNTLRGAAGKLAAWEVAPAAGAAVLGTAVLVPGFTGSKEDFEGMLLPLASAGYRAVAYDQRGQWESEGPEEVSGYSMADFSGDLLDVIDQLSPDAPVHLVGHSFGGFVARAALIARPDRFRSVALIASGPSSVDDVNSPASQLVGQLVEAGGQEVIWQQMSAVMTSAGHVLAPERAEFMRNRILQTKKANMMGILNVMAQAPAQDPALLRAAGVPMLVAYGDTNDLWAPATHQKLAEELQARTAVYPGSGHVPNEEVPEKVSADLVNFWSQLA